MMLTQIRKYRFITPVILVMFSFSAIGFHLDVHFCKGYVSGIKLISFSQSQDTKACCIGICVTENPDDQNCCDDVELSASMDYNGSSISFELENPAEIEIYAVTLHFVIEPEVFRSHIIPSDTGLAISAIQKRILYQSFLC